MFKDKINIYAVPTVSNESGVSGSYERDTYFGVRYDGRKLYFDYYRNGEQRAKKIKAELEDNYLEKGSELTTIHVISNTKGYLGATPTNNRLFSFSCLNELYTDGVAAVHEIAHSIGKLKDEYSYAQDGVNTSTVNEPEQVPWKKLLGFRGVGITPNGNTVSENTPVCYIPTLSCIMKDLKCDTFCEVCKLELVRRMNLLMYPKSLGDYYAAEPDVTIEHSKTGAIGEEYEKYRINADNITKANGHALEFKTLVQNLKNRELHLTVSLDIVNASGKKKMSAKEQFTIPALENIYNGEAAFEAVSAVLENVDGLCSGDGIWGRVVDNDTKQLISEYKSGVKTAVKIIASDNWKSFTVKGENILEGSVVFLALYKNERLEDVKSFLYDGSDMQYTTNKTFDTVKAMAWSLEEGTPLCRASVLRLP